MIKIAVAGVAGKMGRRIADLCLAHEMVKLSGAFETSVNPTIGLDVCVMTGSKTCGVTISDNISDAMKNSDVLIDFTSIESTLQNARYCAENKKAIVIGTTGFSSDQIGIIRGLGEKIPIVMAPNMSVGVNLLLKVLAQVASVLGDEYDIEIIEAHHRLKKDAPSGTALKMAEVIAKSVNRDLDEVGVYSRKGIIGERTKKEIGIQTIRAGDIVGEHTVLFGGIGERIEISHKVSSRDTFAKGAIRAAIWLGDKTKGFYDMQDVLGLKT
ncbi:MAG: 4-hydroxy-tetrahydrodipicolinate reductase [Nitrospirae bacterium]|nr:4-hydroxy-tetrahydrodipicolinate reductase [Nitrospirota bacterium]MBF0540504.1 4-hydroxy-tetrahydrodipicolinate reductase [Nitrospirota bacterium]